MGDVRLHVFLARCGIASRRKCEALIRAGRVEVNGQIVRELGVKVVPEHDRVTVEGRRLTAQAAAYILLCKPRGCVTTADDPAGRPTVMSLLGEMAARLFPVGRLDYDTDGALVMTSDGELAHRLMHPRYGVAKVYHAKLRGTLSDEALVRLCNGVRLDDGTMTRPAIVRRLESSSRHTWIEITIKEGKYRQVHRMAEAVGCLVLKLSRVRYGPLDVDSLAPGAWRPLTAAEVASLRKLVELPPAAHGTPSRLSSASPNPSPPRRSRTPATTPVQNQRRDRRGVRDDDAVPPRRTAPHNPRRRPAPRAPQRRD